MDIVRLDTLARRGWPASAVALGNFDGVHRGHQALVAGAVSEAQAGAKSVVVLTFDPHPARVLRPEGALTELMTLDQKAEILSGLGVERLAVLPFTPALARESPEAFARLVLKEALGARTVVVGEGFRFGHGRAGDVAGLVGYGRALGFEVRVVPSLVRNGAPVSSSRIREHLARGEVVDAGDLLGRRFFVDGLVVRGEGRGRKLGIPTANLAVRNETLPLSGVYASRARVERGAGFAAAVVNLGRRPTFGGEESVLEAHVLDFEGDLYGREIRLTFEARLREERAFSGVPALLEQVRADIAAARLLLEKSGPDGV